MASRTGLAPVYPLKAIIIIRIVEALLLVALSTENVAAETRELNHSAWDALVKEYVNAEARVDYARFKQRGIEKLDAYVGQIAAPWPQAMTVPAQKAALINSYNALTVRWILLNYPVKSIWETQHPFKEPRNTVNGAKVSLDDIEGRLRRMGDPRIHGALVCAARSCPPLRREAYTADRVDAQLDDNVRQWLANDQLNEFLPERRMAQVSMIFKWYKGDFDASSGSVEKFLARYAPASKGAFLLQPSAVIKFNEYHWGLNDSSGLGAHYSKSGFLWHYLKNKL